MPYTPVRDIELIETGSLGKEVLSNDAFSNLSHGISGTALIPLAATDHTLTLGTSGEAQAFVQILTGALTANVNVIVPAESRVYVVDNRTTGAFTVTCRPAAGGGVAVDQSARTLIYCDGTNVYPVASGTGGGGGGGAPTDASYLVGASHTLLSGERVVTNTPTITWDLAAAGQAKAQIPNDAITYTHLQNVTSSRLLGRFAAGAGDVQEITPGTGLTLDAGTGVLSATAVGQPLDATLTALAGLATGANQLPYSTGTDTFAQTPLTAFVRTVLDDADAATVRGTISAQAADATLTALAGVTTGADTLPFFTGVDTASTTTLTAFMRGLLDDPDLATAQATLGITGGGGYTDEQAQDAVGAMLAATATIALAYADATPALTAAVVAGSIGTTQLTDDGVTYAKLQPVTDNRLLGRSAGSAGDAQELTVGAGLSLASGQLSATGGAGSTSTAYDLGTTWSGTLPASQVLLRYPFPRAVTFAAGLPGSGAVAAVAATGAVAIAIAKNGSTIGTINFAAAATIGAFTLASAASFAVGDILTLTAPASADATLAHLGLSLAGTRASVPADGGAPNDAPYIVSAAHSGLLSERVLTNGTQTTWDFSTPGVAILNITPALGTMAQQDAANVAITGGRMVGLTSVDAFPALHVANSSGDNVTALLSEIMLAGGTNRSAVYCLGDAPSRLNGPLAVYAPVGIQAGHVVNAALNLRWAKAGQDGIKLTPSDSDTGYAALQFLSLSNSPIGSITTTASATAYNTTSDVRLKYDITALTGALDVVQALRPVSFLWNADDSKGRGFVASEVQQVVPEAVTGEPDAVDDAGQIVPQGLDMSKLVPYLVGAVQALAEQVQGLTARLEAVGG